MFAVWLAGCRYQDAGPDTWTRMNMNTEHGLSTTSPQAKDDVSFRHGCLCERHGGRPAVAVLSGAEAFCCREQGHG
jgi:hypothetical protein